MAQQRKAMLCIGNAWLSIEIPSDAKEVHGGDSRRVAMEGQGFDELGSGKA